MDISDNEKSCFMQLFFFLSIFPLDKTILIVTVLIQDDWITN